VFVKKLTVSGQEIPRLLWNQTDNRCVHMSPLPGTILNRNNSLQSRIRMLKEADRVQQSPDITRFT